MKIDPGEATMCLFHPGQETKLRCSKCERPICAKCMVSTPVGSRCPDCASVSRLPTYTLSPMGAAKAFGAGLGTGVVLVVLWVLIGWILKLMFPIYLVSLAGSGYIIGESISLASNRKRGHWLQGISALVVCFMFGLLDIINVISITTIASILGLILALALSLSRFR